LKRAPPPAAPPVPLSTTSIKKDFSRRPPVRIESQEQKEKRLAEERAKEGDGEEKSKTSGVVVKANDEDVARRLIEEQERHKAEELKAKEEADRAERERKEAEERVAQEEKDRKEAEERASREELERKEAEERAAREERERERLRLEEARAQREVEEKAERERAEQERLRKLQEEEARAREEVERQLKAEEEALKAAEAADTSHALADESSDAKPDSLPEEGEIEDDASQPAAPTPEESAPASKNVSTQPLPNIPAELPAKPSDKEPLRIDTSLPSPEHTRKRPGPLNLQTTINTNIAPPLPSALATARHIEDINRITYPEGIKSPKVELNVNTQKGKFRYVRWICHGSSVFQHISLLGMIATSYYSS
jgi:translation initiation factor 4G